jgi:hypothetical protein
MDQDDQRDYTEEEFNRQIDKDEVDDNNFLDWLKEINVAGKRYICPSHIGGWVMTTPDGSSDTFAVVDEVFRVKQEGITRSFVIDKDKCIFCNA